MSSSGCGIPSMDFYEIDGSTDYRKLSFPAYLSKPASFRLFR
jgi:hypothetical protein